MRSNSSNSMSGQAKTYFWNFMIHDSKLLYDKSLEYILQYKLKVGFHRARYTAIKKLESWSEITWIFYTWKLSFLHSNFHLTLCYFSAL